MNRRRFAGSALIGAAMLLAPMLLAPMPAPADAAGFGNLTWRSIGPAVSGGRVAAVAGTPQDDRLYYLGTAGGGVWKSSNGGATWQPVFDKESVASIGAVAIDPRDENVVYAGTGESNPRNDVSYGDGLYKSTDGGKTWKNVGLRATRHISRIVIDPKNPAHVVAGALGDVFADSPDRGVYVSFDAGRSWNKTLYAGPRSGAGDVAMDLQHPDTVFAGMWEFRRRPWTFTSGGPDDGLYKSSDGGKTWRRLTGHGLPDGITGRIGLAIAPSNGRRIYALIEAKGGILWRSSDGGATWTMISKNTLVDQRPFYFSHIAVDPRNQNHVYAVSEALSESKDGGKKFEEIAKDVHVDYHAIWIAPNDPARIIAGEDGGYALTVDGGKNWSFSRNLAIGQFYHVAASNENPYFVCGGLQDNNAFCGPSNSLDRDGIKDDHWIDVIGGDGMWAVPDPADPNLIWTDLQDGRISIFNRAAQTNRFVIPYFDFAKNDFNVGDRKYRFNWDSPVAFAPWDARVAWYGGNVVFETTDRGRHWTPIGPDLTLDLKEHQVPAGGPLAYDVSGAEYSDTILSIEGSPLNKGEIWVGTDDGLVQLTRDGGARWQNVTPPGIPPFGRIETVAPSPLIAGTAYANIDRHRSGDYAPYLFVTHDYGKTWTKIVAGLPPDQYVRTVRGDSTNSNLAYAGTEQGLYLSYDGGGHWQNFRLNLPQVSVRDIRIQPQFDDLLLATHGRSLWIMDDLASLQNLPQAQAAGTYLFAPRAAYEYHFHSNDEGAYTRFAGANPPAGAIVDFYQRKPQAKAPAIEILDSTGTVVRRIAGTHKVHGKEVSDVTNKAGINRYVWDFRENGPVLWLGAAREAYRGPKVGALVVPGTYAVRIVLDGKTLTQNVVVKPDPRDAWTQADYQAGHAFAAKYLGDYGKVDQALNNLDAIGKSLASASHAAATAGNTSLVSQIAAAQTARGEIFSLFTADYHNDEDSIQRPGALREDGPSGGFLNRGNQPPTPALLEFAARFDDAYGAAFAKYNAFVASLAPLQTRLKSAALKPLEGVNSISP
ncbi:MAG: glycosyl hydrolase [Candidatus Tumulicola sp.]